jgi:hypothetical protein
MNETSQGQKGGSMGCGDISIIAPVALLSTVRAAAPVRYCLSPDSTTGWVRELSDEIGWIPGSVGSSSVAKMICISPKVSCNPGTDTMMKATTTARPSAITKYRLAFVCANLPLDMPPEIRYSVTRPRGFALVPQLAAAQSFF